MKPIRATVLGIAAVVAGGALVAVLVNQQSDDDSVARDDVSGTPSAAPAAGPSVDFNPLDFGDEPALERRYKKPAQRAVADGLVTMVPAELPDGWTARGGGYQAEDPRWWRMEFDSADGPVVLDQFPRTRDRVLAEHRSALQRQEDVRLDPSDSGAWQHHSHEDGTVLSYRVKGSTVVVQAADLETASALARTLLPAEGRTTSQE